MNISLFAKHAFDHHILWLKFLLFHFFPLISFNLVWIMAPKINISIIQLSAFHLCDIFKSLRIIYTHPWKIIFEIQAVSIENNKEIFWLEKVHLMLEENYIYISKSKYWNENWITHIAICININIGMDWCFSFFRSIHCVCLRIQRMGHGESICVSCKVHWLVSTVDICFFFMFSSSSPFFNTISFIWISVIWANETCTVILFFFSRYLRCGFAFNLFDGKGFFFGFAPTICIDDWYLFNVRNERLTMAITILVS